MSSILHFTHACLSISTLHIGSPAPLPAGVQSDALQSFREHKGSAFDKQPRSSSLPDLEVMWLSLAHSLCEIPGAESYGLDVLASTSFVGMLSQSILTLFSSTSEGRRSAQDSGAIIEKPKLGASINLP